MMLMPAVEWPGLRQNPSRIKSLDLHKNFCFLKMRMIVMLNQPLRGMRPCDFGSSDGGEAGSFPQGDHKLRQTSSCFPKMDTGRSFPTLWILGLFSRAFPDSLSSKGPSYFLTCFFFLAAFFFFLFPVLFLLIEKRVMRSTRRNEC